MVTNVLIVHDNPLFRAGLRSVVARQEDMYLVGEAVQLDMLLELAADMKPIVLFDGGLTSCQPTYCAVEVVDLLRRAGAQGIMVFASSRDEETLFRFLLNGAAAYEPPTITGEELVGKIRKVANGEYLTSSALLPESEPLSFRALVARIDATETPLPFPFEPEKAEPEKVKSSEVLAPEVTDFLEEIKPVAVTSQELDVLRLVMRGLSNTQIARALNTAEYDVRRHLGHLFQRFARRDRTALVVAALRHGVLSFADLDEDVHLPDKKCGTSQNAS